MERYFYLMIGGLADALWLTQRRTLALQRLLEAQHIVTDRGMENEVQAVENIAHLEMEFSEDPEVKQYRKLRQFVQEKLREQEESQGQTNTDEEK